MPLLLVDFTGEIFRQISFLQYPTEEMMKLKTPGSSGRKIRE